MHKTHELNTALAFDFGTKSIGCAVGERILTSARELKPVKARDGIPNWEDIAQIINEWKPDKIVVGLPVNMDGSPMEMTRRARKFGNRVHAKFSRPVVFFDERLSTKEAKAVAAERGHKGNFSDKPIDSIAARLILESWWREYLKDKN